MAESLYIRLKAKDLVASIVKKTCLYQESEECQTGRALYDFLAANFPDFLTLMLLNVYRSSSNAVLNFQSIYLLSETLTDFRNRGFKLSLHTLHEIKLLLISCLTMKKTKESDIKIFRRIVSYVAYNVIVLNNSKWDELGDCILMLASTKPLSAFCVFIELPPVYKKITNIFWQKILDQADSFFSHAEKERVEDWSLALKTVVKVGIQLVNAGLRMELIQALMEIRLSFINVSVKDLLKKGMKQFLVQGLNDFERFLSRDMNLNSYTKEQCDFVSTFMSKIEGIGTEAKDILRRITKPDDPVIKPQNCKAEFDRSWYEHLKNFSAVLVLKIFLASNLEERYREIAIRRVEDILIDHTSQKKEIWYLEMKELQPLLISCLKKGVSDNMFKVLGRVLYHVAVEMFLYQEDTWYDLRDYLVWQSKTDFDRAVYIFQCLPTVLPLENFVATVMANLLPGIGSRLSPPRELLVDNSCWVMAFTGAYCAALNLINLSSESVKGLADAMIDSVRKLVERKMEVGVVRRAFIDLESIVKKQVDLYNTNDYKFVKCLLWRLYAVEGMTWKSKIVVWRINVIVERDMKKLAKKLPKDELDEDVIVNEDVIMNVDEVFVQSETMKKLAIETGKRPKDNKKTPETLEKTHNVVESERLRVYPSSFSESKSERPLVNAEDVAKEAFSKLIACVYRQGDKDFAIPCSN